MTFSIQPSLGEHLSISTHRSPKGIGKSPYSFAATIRYILNLISNGMVSHKRPLSMDLLKQHEITYFSNPPSDCCVLKIIFLGDIMLSKSGEPPTIEKSVKNILKSADIIVANIESPVVEEDGSVRQRKGLSLSFEMPNTYLKQIYDHNPSAQWVMSVANNHACDAGSSTVAKTIAAIKQAMPNSQIIGEQAHSILSLQVKEGPKIGLIAWTDVMNSDKKHNKEPVVRQEDVTFESIERCKGNHDYLIGFPHGGEEQSYYPVEKTRRCWKNLIGSNLFDAVIGHGPHVLQPAEKFREKILFHSIGNFCSPRGPSQTKIGAIFNIQLHYSSEKIHGVEHQIHLIEQNKETVSTCDLSKSKYPKVVQRLRKQWPSLLPSKTSKKSYFFKKTSFKLLCSHLVKTLPFLKNPFQV